MFGSQNSVGLFKIVCVQVKVFIFWAVQEHTSIFYKFVGFIHRDPKYRERMFQNCVDETSLSFSAGELLS